MMASGKLSAEAERAFYLASVPGYKADAPLDYGVPVFQGSQSKVRPQSRPGSQV